LRFCAGDARGRKQDEEDGELMMRGEGEGLTPKGCGDLAGLRIKNEDAGLARCSTLGLGVAEGFCVGGLEGGGCAQG
jgi:hypothetical protein